MDDREIQTGDSIMRDAYEEWSAAGQPRGELLRFWLAANRRFDEAELARQAQTDEEMPVLRHQAG